MFLQREKMAFKVPGQVPQCLNYLDLQAEVFAMVSPGSRANFRSGLNDFIETDPMQLTLPEEEGMHTPVEGSLENLLDPESFKNLQLSTPTKQKAANSSHIGADVIMCHTTASSSGCSISSPLSYQDSRGDSALSQRSLEQRSETNFLGMKSARLLFAPSTEDSFAIMEEYTTEQRVDAARAGFLNLTHLADHIGSSAGCVRMRDDDSDDDAEQDKRVMNVSSTRSTRTYRRRLFTRDDQSAHLQQTFESTKFSS